MKQCGLGRPRSYSGVRRSLRAASGDGVEEQEREKGRRGVREAEKGSQVQGSRGQCPNSGHIGEARDWTVGKEGEGKESGTDPAFRFVQPSSACHASDSRKNDGPASGHTGAGVKAASHPSLGPGSHPSTEAQPSIGPGTEAAPGRCWLGGSIRPGNSWSVCWLYGQEPRMLWENRLWESEGQIRCLQTSLPCLHHRFIGSVISVCEGAYFVAQLLAACFQ